VARYVGVSSRDHPLYAASHSLSALSILFPFVGTLKKKWKKRLGGNGKRSEGRDEIISRKRRILPDRKIKMSSSGIVDLKKWGIQKRAFLAKI